ncbi:MAG: 16S rRNA (cytosine(1402)-N(4))-methyltransferase RsmH [Chloroflexi bacterium]|nr:16S rRNA (cytosine(1402)-N(4))-methyltransferase RsmH [Chloroflexota bacterium]
MAMAPLIYHTPVMLAEVVEALKVSPGGRYVDATVGTGGHTQAILEGCFPSGTVLGIDLDPHALCVAGERLRPYGSCLNLVRDNFARIEEICLQYGFRPVDGVLFDLGMSSLQLEEGRRGFSFQDDEPLDMRFDPSQGLTAAHIVNEYPEERLAALLRRYGEERQSRRIARLVVAHRPVTTTGQLAKLVSQAGFFGRQRIHPATRTFQALRIAVNGELENLSRALEQSLSLLSPEGRLVVVSYHSLEDRIVKEFIRREVKGCLCPPGTPVCLCGHEPTLRLVFKGIVTPAEAERSGNPRSRSARMRVVERL